MTGARREGGTSYGERQLLRRLGAGAAALPAADRGPLRAEHAGRAARAARPGAAQDRGRQRARLPARCRRLLEPVLPAGSDTALLLRRLPAVRGRRPAHAAAEPRRPRSSATYTGERLVLDFRTRLFRHVQRLSLSYHDPSGTSDSTYRIQYDAPAVQHDRRGLDPVVPDRDVHARGDALRDRADRLAAGAGRARGRPGPPRRVLALPAAAPHPVAGGQAPRERGAVGGAGGARGDPRREGLRPGGPRGGALRPAGSARACGRAIRYAVVVGPLRAPGRPHDRRRQRRRPLRRRAHVQAGAITLGELLLVMGYLAQLYAPLQDHEQEGGLAPDPPRERGACLRRCSTRSPTCRSAPGARAAGPRARRPRPRRRLLRLRRPASRAARTSRSTSGPARASASPAPPAPARPRS